MLPCASVNPNLRSHTMTTDLSGAPAEPTLIKPCPFCGQSGVGTNDEKYVYCFTIGCAAWSIEFTLEGWNTRAAPSGSAPELIQKIRANLAALDALVPTQGLTANFRDLMSSRLVNLDKYVNELNAGLSAEGR